jgi:hypothetical protein
MMNADDYGNAGAYFANSSNTQTAYFLGLVTTSGNLGKRPVSVYSVVRQDGTGLAPAARRVAPSAAIIGRLGLRPAAFPLVGGWNYDTPLT